MDTKNFTFKTGVRTFEAAEKYRHKEWRGHPYALNRGRPEKLEPHTPDKNAPRQGVCIAKSGVKGDAVLVAIPSAIKSNYSK